MKDDKERVYGKSVLEMPIFTATEVQLLDNENRSLKLRIKELEAITQGRQEMNVLSSFCWHKWTQWQQYEQKMKMVIQGTVQDFIEFYQKRKCVKCGKEQRVEI